MISVFGAHNIPANLYTTINLKHATDKLPFSDAVKRQQFLVKEKVGQPNLSTLSLWLQPLTEAYEQFEQQNAEHPATHRVHFVQNSKTTIILYRPSAPKHLYPLKDSSHQIVSCANRKNMPPKKDMSMRQPLVFDLTV